MDPVSAGLTGFQVGMTIGEGVFGAGQRRKEAQWMMESVDRQLELLDRQRGYLTSAYKQSVENVTDIYGNRVDTLMARIGSNLMNIQAQAEESQAATGFAYSGSIQKRRQRSRIPAFQQAELGREGILAQLGQSLLTSETQFSRDLGQLNVRTEQLRQERKQYEQKSKEKFLGVF